MEKVYPCATCKWTTPTMVDTYLSCNCRLTWRTHRMLYWWNHDEPFTMLKKQEHKDDQCHYTTLQIDDLETGQTNIQTAVHKIWYKLVYSITFVGCIQNMSDRILYFVWRNTNKICFAVPQDMVITTPNFIRDLYHSAAILIFSHSTKFQLNRGWKQK